MTKVITYGTFDLLHQGHINLLKRAKALGDWLIVGVTTDNFDLERGKLNTCDNVMKRIDAVRATGLADEIIIEEYRGQKIDDIHKYGVDIFAIGSDWEGYFDYLKEFCKVVYLPRTEGISSTMLRQEQAVLQLGIIGTGSIARRFVDESKFVNSISVAAAFNPDKAKAEAFCKDKEVSLATDSLDELLAGCNSVYVASPHYTHYDYVKAALKAGKHVLCETPLVLEQAQAEELFALAKKQGKVLMMAHKTAYCPAFGHLVSLLQSGAIGEIVDFNAATTTITDMKSEKMDSARFGGSVNENACFPLLPILRLFGTDVKKVHFVSKMKDGVDIYTKGLMLFDNACANFEVGLGAKTEGSLVVSGTKGYAYVPAPWWKTEYFELRYEDQNQNKKYFYPFAGEGLRYEIKEFASATMSDGYFYSKLPEKEIIAMTKIQEAFNKKENLTILK